MCYYYGPTPERGPIIWDNMNPAWPQGYKPKETRPQNSAIQTPEHSEAKRPAAGQLTPASAYNAATCPYSTPCGLCVLKVNNNFYERRCTIHASNKAGADLGGAKKAPE